METILSSASREVTIGPEHPFVIIGERINPTGRKILTQQMFDMNMDMVRRDAQRQIDAGAHMLDVNCGIPDDELEPKVLAMAIEAIQEVTDVPISIDSSIIAALEAGLSACKGKALVNSVTGEDERLDKILPLVKKYGAAVVGVSNDETGIPNDPQERLKVARKIVSRAGDYGIPPEDILIDPLVLTISADQQAALNTLETIRLIKQELGVNMVCGASNVSFGLPWREAINTTFLSMAIATGLPSAITNPLKAEIHQCVLAADLLMGHDEYAGNFIAAYRKTQEQE